MKSSDFETNEEYINYLNEMEIEKGKAEYEQEMQDKAQFEEQQDREAQMQYEADMSAQAEAEYYQEFGE